MDDCSEELSAWVLEALPQDDGVKAAFGASAVRVFDAPPVGAKGDYILLGPVHVMPVDGSDAGAAELTLDIWSLVEPPSTAKAKRIGKAVMAFLMTLADLPSHKVKAVLPSEFGSRYLIDQDTRTAHGVLKVEVVTQPKPQP